MYCHEKIVCYSYSSNLSETEVPDQWNVTNSDKRNNSDGKLETTFVNKFSNFETKIEFVCSYLIKVYSSQWNPWLTEIKIKQETVTLKKGGKVWNSLWSQETLGNKNLLTCFQSACYYLDVVHNFQRMEKISTLYILRKIFEKPILYSIWNRLQNRLLINWQNQIVFTNHKCMQIWYSCSLNDSYIFRNHLYNIYKELN